MSTAATNSRPTTETGSIEPFTGRLNVVSKFLFWLFVIFTLALLGLEVGVWETTETHWGPFAQDPFVPASLSGRSVGFAIYGEHAFKCCVGIRPDIKEHPSQSDLRLWINEHEMGPAHVPHELIRNGETTGFSNWAGYVIFPLPQARRTTPRPKPPFGMHCAP